MLCNRCIGYQEDHTRTSKNIKIINRLLVLTEAQEESHKKGKRLAMLRRNAKSNYIIIVNLDYIMKAKCTSENYAPKKRKSQAESQADAPIPSKEVVLTEWSSPSMWPKESMTKKNVFRCALQLYSPTDVNTQGWSYPTSNNQYIERLSSRSE